MSRAELKKVIVVEKIIGGHMTNEEGAAALGLSNRQVIRLKKKYMTEGGAAALAYRNRGRKPSHALTDEVRERVTAHYSQQYTGSNSCHFAELLEEREALVLSASSVRRILLAKGLKQAKQRRHKKAHQPRELRSQAGALWQIELRLDYVFTIRELRTLGQGNTLSYANKTYTFAKPSGCRLDAKTVVEVRQKLAGDVIVWHGNAAIQLVEIAKPVRTQPQEKKRRVLRRHANPPQHPWQASVHKTRVKNTTKKSDFQEAMYSTHNSHTEALW